MGSWRYRPILRRMLLSTDRPRPIVFRPTRGPGIARLAMLRHQYDKYLVVVAEYALESRWPREV